ncbi:hypothetical protein, partial [uncultured Brevundimonas sp.]|uniref:hypothetical protein n=1 Tax=uncultured Brevundimonas sp. TaxID=213418 RepID=UPI00261E8E4B
DGRLRALRLSGVVRSRRHYCLTRGPAKVRSRVFELRSPPAADLPQARWGHPAARSQIEAASELIEINADA